METRKVTIINSKTQSQKVIQDSKATTLGELKKVKSGAMSRAEAYAEIKKRGLQGACVDKFGKNFTQCPTADLISLIEKNSTKAAPAPKAEKPVEAAPAAPAKAEEAPVAPETPATGCNCSKALAILTEALYENDTIEEETYDAVMATLKGGSYNAPEKMSKREIDEMFGFVER